MPLFWSSSNRNLLKEMYELDILGGDSLGHQFEPDLLQYLLDVLVVVTELN